MFSFKKSNPTPSLKELLNFKEVDKISSVKFSSMPLLSDNKRHSFIILQIKERANIDDQMDEQRIFYRKLKKEIEGKKHLSTSVSLQTLRKVIYPRFENFESDRIEIPIHEALSKEFQKSISDCRTNFFTYKSFIVIRFSKLTKKATYEFAEIIKLLSDSNLLQVDQNEISKFFDNDYIEMDPFHNIIASEGESHYQILIDSMYNVFTDSKAEKFKDDLIAAFGNNFITYNGVVPTVSENGVCSFLDIDDSFSIIGIAGSGKTTQMSSIVKSYLDKGTRTYIIDNSESYEHFSKFFNSKRFDLNKDLSINILSLVSEDNDNNEIIDAYIDVINALVGGMQRAERNQVKEVVKHVVFSKKNKGTLKDVVKEMGKNNKLYSLMGKLKPYIEESSEYYNVLNSPCEISFGMEDLFVLDCSELYKDTKLREAILISTILIIKEIEKKKSGSFLLILEGVDEYLRTDTTSFIKDVNNNFKSLHGKLGVSLDYSFHKENLDALPLSSIIIYQRAGNFLSQGILNNSIHLNLEVKEFLLAHETENFNSYKMIMTKDNKVLFKGRPIFGYDPGLLTGSYRVKKEIDLKIRSGLSEEESLKKVIKENSLG